MSKRLKLGLLTLIIILLGFLRGYLFGNINWIYLNLTNGRPNGARHEFDFMLTWDVSNILILKWGLTLLFFGLFTVFTWLIVKLAFNKKEFNKITLLLFAGLFLLSAILYIPYYLTGSQPEMYAVIRTILGIGQSFMPLMFLFVLFKFLPQIGRKN